MIRRGDIYWADLGPPRGSAPAKLRPVVVIQDDEWNDSRLATTIVAVLTRNLEQARMPGNVLVPAVLSGLPHDSVLNVTALSTLDRRHLEDFVGRVPDTLMGDVGRGLADVLGLKRR